MNYDELVKKLRSGCDTCKLWDGSKCCLDGDCTRQTILQAADAIEELQARVKENDDWWAMAKTLADMVAPKWIPVTEKPPLKVGDDGYNGYLVYANDYYAVADYTVDKFDDVQYFYVDGEYEPDVTHYMTLPKPPREEAE